jgi:hypothetical protein
MGLVRTTRAETLGRAALGVAVAALVLVVGVPVLLLWWLSTPEPAPSAEDAGVMDQLREVAYGLRNERVRDVVDRGGDLPAVAKLIGTTALPRAQVRAVAEPGAERLALIAVHTIGRSGLDVDLVQSRVPAGRSTVLFARESRPWVGCYRVELPVLAIDSTVWSARDITCPTFSDTLQRADRVHVDGVVARPLLRPPCFGTTGYCPGG